nr:M23 family metallopeptidase [Bacillus massiliglaciei]
MSGVFQSKAQANTAAASDNYTIRMQYYKNIEAVLQIPWYYIAGADQYEHTLRKALHDREDAKGPVGIYMDPVRWTGPLNPDKTDINPLSISLFEGLGLDGDGDGKADLNNDFDRLYSFAKHLMYYGTDEENIRIGLWDYYKRDKAVSIIMNNAKIYKAYGKLDLQQKAFPLPVKSEYTYRDTWGDPRGWGGRRIHEGTDLFADYGLPVRSTCYGVIEMKGWNKYGGWRIGIRDLNNTYHYFAHLSGFSKDLKAGQTVKPGQVIGGVGSTGYGPPGTSGKFPPHLHFGLYKDNGFTEWSFDPYPSLKLWERQELTRK